MSRDNVEAGLVYGGAAGAMGSGVGGYAGWAYADSQAGWDRIDATRHRLDATDHLLEVATAASGRADSDPAILKLVQHHLHAADLSDKAASASLVHEQSMHSLADMWRNLGTWGAIGSGAITISGIILAFLPRRRSPLPVNQLDQSDQDA